uniref:Protein amnionless n=1 Tax=Scophthalmus maximus TaxID=52904 RepID=A0A8D3B6C4_SCOMX
MLATGRSPDVLLLFCLVGAADALYKRWIPDTNYENETNWDKGAVPCGNDVVRFSAQTQVSVFVESAHAVRETRLPVDGEFILNSGGGFYASAGREPGCGPGVATRFKDPGSLRWFDPALWQAAASLDDLRRGRFLFSVHEESVPCRWDDVVFRALSSFRVDTGSGGSSVPVRAVSVRGKVFDGRAEFAQYLSSRSGRLQFHGSSAVTVGNPGCGDPSGCECGNSANRRRICSSVTCASVECKKPLLPVGHCCEVCGAIVTIRYAAGFDLQTYRQRIHHLFLVLPKYKSVQLGMSKVSRSRRLMGIVPFGASPEVQLTLLDGEKGAESEALAWDVVSDARSHGSVLGIAGAEFRASSGGGGSSSDQSGASAGTVVGVVLAVFVAIAIVIVVALIRRGVVRMPSMPSAPSLSSFTRKKDGEELGGPLDRGYDNPMFDNLNMLPDVPGLHGNEANSISITQTGGVYFANPVYDENETDFNA